MRLLLGQRIGRRFRFITEKEEADQSSAGPEELGHAIRVVSPNRRRESAKKRAFINHVEPVLAQVMRKEVSLHDKSAQRTKVRLRLLDGDR